MKIKILAKLTTNNRKFSKYQFHVISTTIKKQKKITMKFMKITAFSFVLSAVTAIFAGCSDDDATSKVLLRPVTSMQQNQNSVSLSWQNVPEATEYIIEVFREGESGFEPYNTYTTTETSYTVSGLDWDSRYKVQVKSSAPNRESAYWELSEFSIVYPTKLGQTKAIDNSARITWGEGGNIITAITATPQNDESAMKTYAVSAEEYAAGEVIINDLTPETTYTICAYSGSEQTVDTYEGKITLTTAAAENYDELYGVGKWKDMRNDPAADDPEYFNNPEFWENIEDGTTIILAGGKEYNMGDGNSWLLTKSIGFATAMTLGNNARFIVNNAINFAENSTIDFISFKSVDLIGGGTALEEATSNSLNGKQVVCPDKANSNVHTVTFTNCFIQNFRAAVRIKEATAGIETLLFKGCTIDAIGNQGMISTDGKDARLINTIIDECTITNTYMIADIRKAQAGDKVTISNSTFCYVPQDVKNGALFRFNNLVELEVANSVFGPALATSSGSIMDFNKAGTNGLGQGFYSGTKGATTVTNSYSSSDLKLNNGLSLTNSSLNGTELFQNPANGDFKLSGMFSGSGSAGATKWRL